MGKTMSITYLNNQDDIESELKTFLDYIQTLRLELQTQKTINRSDEYEGANLLAIRQTMKSAIKYNNIPQHLNRTKGYNLNDLAENFKTRILQH